MSEDLEKIKRHLAKKVPITIKNEDGVEDVFYFKPLNVEQQALMIGISKKFQGKTKEDLEEIDAEDYKEMINIIKSVVKNSLGLEEPILEEFVLTNFDVLSDKLVDLLPKTDRTEKLDLIKKKMEAAKNAKVAAVKGTEEQSSQ